MFCLKAVFRTIAPILVILCAAFISSCREEIVDPPSTDDRLPANEPRSVDLNGDGFVDFEFYYLGLQTDDYPPSSAMRFLEVRAEDSNQVQFTDRIGPIAMEDGISIDETIGWTKYGTALASISWSRSRGWDSTWSGPWIGVGERSLGVRLRKQGTYYYGWVKLSVSREDGAVTVTDSAYQPLGNTAILSGIRP